MKSKAVAITPKKLASSLRDFQDSNIKPIQQSLDKTQEILTTIVESIKHSPSTDTRSDPFIEQLRGPMPSIYNTTDTLAIIEENFFTNIDTILSEYRLQRGDDINRIYTETESANDRDTIYYIHTQWCNRLLTIKNGLQSHKRMISLSQDSPDNIKEITKRSKETESVMSTDPIEQNLFRQYFSPESVKSDLDEHQQPFISLATPDTSAFITASELHRLMNSANPEDRSKANQFFTQPLQEPLPFSNTPAPMSTYQPQHIGNQHVTYPTSPYQSTIKTITLPHVATPSINTWNGHSVTELTAWYSKLHHHSHSLQQQWEILATAIPNTQLQIAENAIRTHIHHRFRITSGSYLDINLDELPFGNWPITTFLRLLNDVYGYKNKMTYNYEHTLSTNLMRVGGAVVPGDIQAATLIATKFMDLNPIVMMLSLSQKQFITQLKSWARSCSQPPNYSVDFSIIQPKWIEILTESIDPLTNKVQEVTSLSILANRILYFGTWATTKRDEGNPFGKWIGSKEEYKSKPIIQPKPTFTKPTYGKGPIQSQPPSKYDKSVPTHTNTYSNNKPITNKSPVCQVCGRTHNLSDPCHSLKHPNANLSAKPWAESDMGKKWATLGHPFLVRNKRITPDGKLEDMPADMLALLKTNPYTKKGTSPAITINSLSQSHNICPDTIVPTLSDNINNMIYIPAYVGHVTPTIPVKVLIDTGSSQANLICKAFAAQLRELGAIITAMRVTLSPGFGGNDRMCEVSENMIEFVIAFSDLNNLSINYNRVYTIRAIIVNDLDSSILIGFPTIQQYGFIDILRAHMTLIPQIPDICYKTSHPLPTSNIKQLHYIDTYSPPMDNTINNLQENIIHINNILAKVHIKDV
jgi:hypothetical protein